MDVKGEFRTALESGANDAALLELVRRHKASGLAQRDAYDALQELWQEYGFHDDDQTESEVRNNLEYVMENVWGFCPAAAAIWPESLSNEKQPT
ncbi:MAG: hypothetical protein WD069_06235 [Planctomycetales bacterium]